MTYLPVKTKIGDGINFTVVKDDRFKTGRISVSMFLPLEEETASINAIIPFLLVKSCRIYNDFTALNKRLADLYGASLSADVDKIGDSQVLSISATFLDDRYSLDSECISSEITNLLCSVIFDPDIENKSFPKQNVEQEKRQLIEMIDAQYNDKKVFAKQRCISIMCKNERFGINQLGTREQLEKLDGEKIYLAWVKLLENAKIEIMMLGNSDHTHALNGFKKSFEKIQNRNVVNNPPEFIKSVKRVKEVSEIEEISQCKLVMGFRTRSNNVDDNVSAFRIMNALLGATPHSKLFANVREKLSLCYYCASRFDRNKGILTIESGVEKKNIETAKNEILNQIEEIKKGNFTDDDINTTKLSICNSFRTIADYLGAIENFYTLQIFSLDVKTLEDSTREANKVTREQIIDCANRLELDTIYSLIN